MKRFQEWAMRTVGNSNSGPSILPACERPVASQKMHSHNRLQSHRSPITDYCLPITDYCLPITDHRLRLPGSLDGESTEFTYRYRTVHCVFFNDCFYGDGHGIASETGLV